MEIKITTKNSMVTHAESVNGRYSWFWGLDGYIKDTVTRKTIYQMSYMRTDAYGSDPVPEDVAADVRAFWLALQDAQRRIEQHKTEPVDQDVTSHPKMPRAYYDLVNEGGEGFTEYKD